MIPPSHSSLPPSETREIRKASGILAFFTMLSRVLGLVRNQVLSHFFGAGFIADAFIAAFTIPNALRRLFGEGALTPAIVALLTRAHRQSKPGTNLGKEDWQDFLSNAFVWLTIALTILTGLGMLFAPVLVRIYVPEFSSTPGKLELTISLTRYLFPFILFIGWSAFFMGILNTFRSFAISAAGPAALNLTVITLAPIALWGFNPSAEEGIYIYGGAMLLGGLLQALIQLPDLRRFRALPYFHFRTHDPMIRELVLILIPSFFSMGIYQLNIIVNRIFASDIPGAVSHLFYADLLLELPVAILATSVGTAVLPSFSRLLSANDQKGLADTFKVSLTAIWIMAIPSTAGLLILAKPLVSTIYLTGKFTLYDSGITSQALIAYAVGLPFFATLRVVLPLFFAEKDTRTPAYVGFGALFVNLLMAWMLSHSMHTTGIALATSISSAFNLFVLSSLVVRRYRSFEWRPLMLIFVKIVICALGMSAALWGIQNFIPVSIWETVGVSITKVSLLLGLVTVGIVIYFGLAYALGVPHLKALTGRLGSRFRRNQK